MSTRSNVPSFRKRGFRLFDREVASGLLKCRAVFRADSTFARVRFFPSRRPVVIVLVGALVIFDFERGI
jgi:hypothetical protein